MNIVSRLRKDAASGDSCRATSETMLEAADCISELAEALNFYADNLPKQVSVRARTALTKLNLSGKGDAE